MFLQQQARAAIRKRRTDLGLALARNKLSLVYGGNNVGSMGVLAGACHEAGGKVIGVTPKLSVDKGVADRACNELIVTDGMRDRKAVIEQRGDAFIALPGGLGTFEEFFEIVCGKQLEYHDKAIILLNIDGYYNPLLAMIATPPSSISSAPSQRAVLRRPTVDQAMDYFATTYRRSCAICPLKPSCRRPQPNDDRITSRCPPRSQLPAAIIISLVLHAPLLEASIRYSRKPQAQYLPPPSNRPRHLQSISINATPPSNSVPSTDTATPPMLRRAICRCSDAMVIRRKRFSAAIRSAPAASATIHR